MGRINLTALLFISGLATSAFSDDIENVHWKLDRNVKEVVLKELDRFEENLTTTLGPEVLAVTPYIIDREKYPDAPPLDMVTVEEIVDGMLDDMNRWFDHDNDEYLPKFAAFRHTGPDGGSDFRTEPYFLPGPTFGNRAGNIECKLEWELVDGYFANERDHNDVDEVYKVELNATLTLGIFLRVRSEQAQTVIRHTVTKPIITGWRTSLVASEGEVQERYRSGTRDESSAEKRHSENAQADTADSPTKEPSEQR